MSKRSPFFGLSSSVPIALGVFAVLHACSGDVTVVASKRPRGPEVDNRPLAPDDDPDEPASGSKTAGKGMNDGPATPSDAGDGDLEGISEPDPPDALSPEPPGPAFPGEEPDAGPHASDPEPLPGSDSPSGTVDAGPAIDSGPAEPTLDAGGPPAADPPASCARGVRCEHALLGRCGDPGAPEPAFEALVECGNPLLCAVASESCTAGVCSLADTACTLPPSGSPLLDVNAGPAHACALLEGGRVRCWGESDEGKLGHPSLTEGEEHLGDDEPPSSAGDVELGEPALAIAAGARNTCVILAQGRVRCWGDARDGRLGDGKGGRDEDDIGDDEAPASGGDVPLGEPAVQVAVGSGFTCALLASGAVRCWGLASDGKLGSPGVIFALGDDETPLAVPPVDLGERAVSIAAGSSHACAILESGAVRCWGRNNARQLGYGHRQVIGDDEGPSTQPPLALGGRAIQLALGNAHSCALLADRSLRCWGTDLNSQLGGGGSFVEGELPDARPPLDLGQPVLQVAAGGAHSCALLADHTLRCWGSNSRGQLGAKSVEGELGLADIPPFIDLGAEARRVEAGGDYTCAALSSGQLSCWGLGDAGNLGLNRATPLGESGRFIIGDDETPAEAGPVLLF